METKPQKCQLHFRGLFIVNERQPSTKGFYKNEIPVKEFIISPSFIFTKNELSYRFFKVFCTSCRIPILQNISRRLLLKQTGENYYLTHLQPMFHLNPLIPTKNSQKIKGFRCFLGAKEWSVRWKWVSKDFLFLPLQTLHVYSTLKRRGNIRFHVVSTWNTRGVFVGTMKKGPKKGSW